MTKSSFGDTQVVNGRDVFVSEIWECFCDSVEGHAQLISFKLNVCAIRLRSPKDENYFGTVDKQLAWCRSEIKFRLLLMLGSSQHETWKWNLVDVRFCLFVWMKTMMNLKKKCNFIKSHVYNYNLSDATTVAQKSEQSCDLIHWMSHRGRCCEGLLLFLCSC